MSTDETFQVARQALTAQPPRRALRSGPVTTLRVDRRVWREALRLADGDGRRIRIISATRVEIRP